MFKPKSDFFKQFANYAEWKSFVTNCGEIIFKQLNDGDKDIRESFRREYDDFKKSSHPYQKSSDLEHLNETYKQTRTPEVGKALRECIKHIDSSDEIKHYQQVFGISDRELAKITKQDEEGKQGRSNRARRAKETSVLFRGAEELTKATMDIHGNTAGGGGDLGRDGAFIGLTILVIQQYHIPKGQWIKDLEKKGFAVDIYVMFDNDAQFESCLDSANQVWLISSSQKMLTEKQLDIMCDKWKEGLPFYIFGDNDPFYVDANRLLCKMGLPKMYGDYRACKYISEYSERTSSKGGFVKCLPMTGITLTLYEGATIAEMSPEEVTKTGCVPIMFNSRGKISVVMREAMEGCGQVIIDGAFTKLYCEYDAAGSKYLVINSACYLAANFSEPKPDTEPEPEPVIHEIDYEGALKGLCDITCDDEEPLAIAISTMEPQYEEQFTSDYVLDDTLAMGGPASRYAPEQQFGQSTATMMVIKDSNFFTRQRVRCLIPLVSLKHFSNRLIIKKLLSVAFMCGLNLPSAIWLLFLGICDFKSGNNPDHPETWDYMIKEIIENIKSTPDFSDVGEKVPIIYAMSVYSQMDAIKRNRKSFTTTCLMSRTLKKFSPGEDVGNLINWCRQSLIKMIVAEVLKFSKAKPEDTQTKEWFDDIVINLLYKCNSNIPIKGTAQAIKIIDFLKQFFKSETVDVYTRIIGDLEVPALLSDSMVTTLIYKLFTISKKDMVRYQVESLLSCMKETPYIADVWNGKEIDFKPIIEKPYEGFHVPDDPHSRGTPFATPYGPSVYFCECGEQFGDPTKEVTPEYSEMVKNLRNAHFQEVYGANKEGYPQPKSSHYNLHRGVQRVMTRQKNRLVSEISEEIVDEVCAYLKKDQRTRGGDIFIGKLKEDIYRTIASYLECRSKGMKEPAEGEIIHFITKMKVEQELILSS